MSRKAATQLTLAGTPRKRAPGAGRPSEGRTANMPRIKPQVYDRLARLAQHNSMTVAATLESCIGMCADREGIH